MQYMSQHREHGAITAEGYLGVGRLCLFVAFAMFDPLGLYLAVLVFVNNLISLMCCHTRVVIKDKCIRSMSYLSSTLGSR